MQVSLRLLRAGPLGAGLGSMRMGGGVGPEDRQCFDEGKSEGNDAILVAIEEAPSGVFHPNRENEELTRALGNPEHSGRTRGKGAILWYEGFSDWNTDYRTRARKKIAEEKKRKMEEEQRKRDYERLQGLEASQAELAVKFQWQQEQIDSLTQQRGSQQLQQLADDPALDSTAPSMPRSSVGSAPDDAMLGRYPVDDITENTNCELHVKITNISMKVADAVAFTNPPEATFHCNPIPAGYARVLLDEVVDPPYSELQLDIPGGDDERFLGEAKHRIILWKKDCIIFRRPPTPRQPTPRRSPPPSQQTPAPASPPSPAKCQATPPPSSPPQRQTSTPPPSLAQPQATPPSPAQLQATPPRPTQPRQPSPLP